MENPGASPPASLSRLTKAELIARLEALPCAPSHRLEACPAQRLRLELGTHQIELETQNQELRESHQRIEEARDRYSDLYDFAPVGYATLDWQGCMQEINLTGAAMLGCERKEAIGKPLILWLQRDCHEAFHQHLRRVRTTGDRVVDEMTLKDAGGPPRHISMVSAAVAEDMAAGHACRTALVDISALKEKERALVQSRQQLRELSGHLEQVRENERKHMAREIHDELGQRLTALRFEVAMLREGKPPARGKWPGIADALMTQIDATIESVRNLAADLRPAVLDLGLVAAIEWQVRQFSQRTGIACTLKVNDEEICLDNECATAVFRIVQESLTNIARHADASKVRLSLHKGGGRLHIRVQDDGIGLPEKALDKPRSFGLRGMRERVLLLDGEMEFSSRPGEGARLDVAIPLRKEA